MIPANFGQQVHVGIHGNDVESCGHAIVLAFIGGGGQHGLGELVRIGLEVLVETDDSAGVDELAQEAAGPGEEDVGQIFGVAAHHRGLDLGLVGLVLESFHLDLDFRMRGLIVGDRLQVGRTVCVGLCGDAPEFQDGLLCCGLGCGSSRLSCGSGCGSSRLSCGSSSGCFGLCGACYNAEYHTKCEGNCKNLFHGNPPF